MTGQYWQRRPAGPERPRVVDLRLGDMSLQLSTAAGVFGASRVDHGTVTLLRHAPTPGPGTAVVDVGAGYGPIAVTLALRQPAAGVWAVDVNERALELVGRNAAASGASNVVVAGPQDVPVGLRFDGLYSNPPIKIGRDALHQLLLEWLSRLVPGGHAWLVVKQSMGADSLQGWLGERGYPTTRAVSKQGYRLLRAEAGTAGPPPPTPGAELLDRLARDTGDRWRMLGHLHDHGGEPVYLLGRSGRPQRRAVLKVKYGDWWAGQLARAVTVVEQLRAAGYPTPPILAAGTLDEDRGYLLTDFWPGWPGTVIAPAALETVLAAADLHTQVQPPAVRDWSVMVTAFLNGGIADFDFHPDALPYARRALALVTRPVPMLPTGHFVHGDFTTRNMLFRQGRLSAVVDLEGFGRGTPVIDLVALLPAVTDPAHGTDLSRRVVERATALGGTDVFLACLAHRVLAGLAWATTQPPLLPGALERARRMLDLVG
jgi:hypothetical protein